MCRFYQSGIHVSGNAASREPGPSGRRDTASPQRLQPSHAHGVRGTELCARQHRAGRLPEG